MPSSTPAALAAPASPHEERTAALVVEDHAAMRALMAAIVASHGGWDRVLEAATLTQAWQMLSDTGLGLALVDLRLPDGDGADVVRYIRSQPHLCTMPVVAMTADTDDDLRLQLLEAGVDAYVVKSQGRHAVHEALTHAVTVRP